MSTIIETDFKSQQHVFPTILENQTLLYLIIEIKIDFHFCFYNSYYISSCCQDTLMMRAHKFAKNLAGGYYI